jgi:zinc transport system ATP-binding protein
MTTEHTDDTSTLIRLEGVSKVLNERAILHHIDLGLRANSITTIIGPNGAGKTSLLRIALGLETPTTGKVIRQPTLKLGYVPQRFHKDPMLPLTVIRFLQLAPAGPSNAIIMSTLEEVGASHLLDQSLNTLSGGEVQRVLLARALLNTPDLLALDEPMQGVDLLGQAELYQLLDEIQQRHACSILMVSHDLHFVMAAANQVVCLNHHICCSGRPEDVRAHPEYQALFGSADLKGLGIYSHHHDHDHGLDGSIKAPQDQTKNNATPKQSPCGHCETPSNASAFDVAKTRDPD